MRYNVLNKDNRIKLESAHNKRWWAVSIYSLAVFCAGSALSVYYPAVGIPLTALMLTVTQPINATFDNIFSDIHGLNAAEKVLTIAESKAKKDAKSGLTATREDFPILPYITLAQLVSESERSNTHLRSIYDLFIPNSDYSEFIRKAGLCSIRTLSLAFLLTSAPTAALLGSLFVSLYIVQLIHTASTLTQQNDRVGMTCLHKISTDLKLEVKNPHEASLALFGHYKTALELEKEKPVERLNPSPSIIGSAIYAPFNLANRVFSSPVIPSNPGTSVLMDTQESLAEWELTTKL